MSFFHMVYKHIVIACITFAIVLIGTCLYTFLVPTKYSATVKMFATYSDVSGNGSDNYSNLNNAGTYISSQIKSYPSLVTTSAVLDPVITKLGLDTTASDLAKQIEATNPSNTAFIDITVTDENAAESAAIANAVAESLSTVIQQSLYSSGSQSPIKITTVESAQIPTVASFPNVKLNIAFGIFAGIVLGVLVALLRDLLSTKIQNENELISYIDAPVLGRIPESGLLLDSMPIVIEEPGGPIAEDYRRICTNLSFIAPVSGTNSRLIVISAVGTNEGKTTTSVNIAAALAESGSTVLLIDADLRHPSVAKKLEIDGSAGLAHVLSGQAAVKDVVQRYWKPNLHIMPAGPKPPNAATLLNSPIMTELLNHALHQYDYVIVDTAPMIVANEAALFAKQGGGLVLISRRGMTLKKQFVETADELRNLDVSVTGFVFTWAKADKKALAGSSYYYYTSADGSHEHHHEHRSSSSSHKVVD
ncbi:polysaccharide biosynthesis tyrosine autokinase [Bifidobacterium choloepi]|uniref:non-specific protein-tyrosine kinase n=1 Tax=Bifidobacterium choloepi TaxID=2614131 RepID=A0A6I5N1K2_9BIFI|nr:polysaccharide biosynthesis tyrosine autokinase [Bifidobacterium choloepi]NEG70356.1 polysaccharide biosynthesis tyrosine autokinase [Bifidobacterium choloepi]